MYWLDKHIHSQLQYELLIYTFKLAKYSNDNNNSNDNNYQKIKQNIQYLQTLESFVSKENARMSYFGFAVTPTTITTILATWIVGKLLIPLLA